MDYKKLCALRRRQERRGFNEARAREKEYEPIAEEKASYNKEENMPVYSNTGSYEKGDERSSVEEVKMSEGSEVCKDLRDYGNTGSGEKLQTNRDIWKLKDVGCSLEEIRDAVGVSRMCVWRHIKKYGRME